MDNHQPFDNDQDPQWHEQHHGGECVGYLPDDVRTLLKDIRNAHSERLGHLVRLVQRFSWQ